MGESCGVLYLDTEGAFAPNRLAEILSVHGVPIDAVAQCVSRIRLIGRIESLEKFEDVLGQLEVAIASNDIKFIVIDSIAALVRKDFDLSSIPLRQSKLANVASQLKRLAEAFQIPVLIVNQVTTQFNEGNGFVTAALGTAWSHSVNTRLVLEPTSGKDDFEIVANDDSSLRRLTIAKSPIAPVVMMAVRVWSGGIQMVQNPKKAQNAAEGEEGQDDDIFEKYLVAFDPANFWTHGISSSSTHTAIK